MFLPRSFIAAIVTVATTLVAAGGKESPVAHALSTVYSDYLNNKKESEGLSELPSCYSVPLYP